MGWTVWYLSPGRARDFFPSAKCHEHYWGPPSFPFTGYLDSFPRGKAARSWISLVTFIKCWGLRMSGAIPLYSLHVVMVLAGTALYFVKYIFMVWTQLYVVWCSRVKFARIFVHLPIVLELNIGANTITMLALLLCFHTKASHFPFLTPRACWHHPHNLLSKYSSFSIMCMSGKPSVETWVWGSCPVHRNFWFVHKVTRSNS